ncbi:MAG: hypothetical protein ABIG30_03945 [Candidatus Aenigmatarchaeota archaeon]
MQNKLVVVAIISMLLLISGAYALDLNNVLYKATGKASLITGHLYYEENDDCIDNQYYEECVGDDLYYCDDDYYVSVVYGGCASSGVDCNGITDAGLCDNDGEGYQWCDYGTLRHHDCGAGTTCQRDSTGWSDCVSTGGGGGMSEPGITRTPGCGNIDGYGFCYSAAILKYCDEGLDEIVTEECAVSRGTGYVCYKNEQGTMAECVKQQSGMDCAGITYEGTCEADTLKWCDDSSYPGELVIENCASDERVCNIYGGLANCVLEYGTGTCYRDEECDTGLSCSPMYDSVNYGGVCCSPGEEVYYLQGSYYCNMPSYDDIPDYSASRGDICFTDIDCVDDLVCKTDLTYTDESACCQSNEEPVMGSCRTIPYYTAGPRPFADNYCTRKINELNQKCAWGEGDCDSNSQCQNNLICVDAPSSSITGIEGADLCCNRNEIVSKGKCLSTNTFYPANYDGGTDAVPDVAGGDSDTMSLGPYSNGDPCTQTDANMRGKCENNNVIYCNTNDQWNNYDCGSGGCGFDFVNDYYDCVGGTGGDTGGTGEGMDPFTYEGGDCDMLNDDNMYGTCDGNTAIYCYVGSWVADACTGGKSCGYADYGADCLSGGTDKHGISCPSVAACGTDQGLVCKVNDNLDSRCCYSNEEVSSDGTKCVPSSGGGTTGSTGTFNGQTVYVGAECDPGDDAQWDGVCNGNNKLVYCSAGAEWAVETCSGGKTCTVTNGYADCTLPSSGDETNACEDTGGVCSTPAMCSSWSGTPVPSLKSACNVANAYGNDVCCGLPVAGGYEEGDDCTATPDYRACDNNVLEWCGSSKTILIQDCGSGGCGMGSDGVYDCLALPDAIDMDPGPYTDGSSCDSTNHANVAGKCEGNNVIYCNEDNRWTNYDCGASGCELGSNGYYDCIPSGTGGGDEGMDTFTYEGDDCDMLNDDNMYGTCDGNTAIYCYAGSWVADECVGGTSCDYADYGADCLAGGATTTVSGGGTMSPGPYVDGGTCTQTQANVYGKCENNKAIYCGANEWVVDDCMALGGKSCGYSTYGAVCKAVSGTTGCDSCGSTSGSCAQDECIGLGSTCVYNNDTNTCVSGGITGVQGTFNGQTIYAGTECDPGDDAQWDGVCNGNNKLVYCSAGAEWAVESCSGGKTCTVTDGYADCTLPSSGCGDIKFAGKCDADGNGYNWCYEETDTLQPESCNSDEVCEQNPGELATCVPKTQTTGCGSITVAGKCDDGNKGYQWCQTNTIKHEVCDGDTTCQSMTSGWVDCLPSSGTTGGTGDEIPPDETCDSLGGYCWDFYDYCLDDQDTDMFLCGGIDSGYMCCYPKGDAIALPAGGSAIYFSSSCTLGIQAQETACKNCVTGTSKKWCVEVGQCKNMNENCPAPSTGSTTPGQTIGNAQVGGPCGAVPSSGTCIGNVLEWCGVDNTLRIVNCAAQNVNKLCGPDASSGQHKCYDSAATAASNVYNTNLGSCDDKCGSFLNPCDKVECLALTDESNRQCQFLPGSMWGDTWGTCFSVSSGNAATVGLHSTGKVGTVLGRCQQVCNALGFGGCSRKTCENTFDEYGRPCVCDTCPILGSNYCSTCKSGSTPQSVSNSMQQAATGINVPLNQRVLIDQASWLNAEQKAKCKSYAGDTICDGPTGAGGTGINCVPGTTVSNSLPDCRECETKYVDSRTGTEKISYDCLNPCNMVNRLNNDYLCDSVQQECDVLKNNGLIISSVLSFYSAQYSIAGCAESRYPTNGFSALDPCEMFNQASDKYCDDTQANCAAHSTKIYRAGISVPECRETSDKIPTYKSDPNGNWQKLSTCLQANNNNFSQCLDAQGKIKGATAIPQGGNAQVACAQVNCAPGCQGGTQQVAKTCASGVCCECPAGKTLDSSGNCVDSSSSNTGSSGTCASNGGTCILNTLSCSNGTYHTETGYSCSVGQSCCVCGSGKTLDSTGNCVTQGSSNAPSGVDADACYKLNGFCVPGSYDCMIVLTNKKVIEDTSNPAYILCASYGKVCCVPSS